jgi:hypothetical protein
VLLRLMLLRLSGVLDVRRLEVSSSSASTMADGRRSLSSRRWLLRRRVEVWLVTGAALSGSWPQPPPGRRRRAAPQRLVILRVKSQDGRLEGQLALRLRRRVRPGS